MHLAKSWRGPRAYRQMPGNGHGAWETMSRLKCECIGIMGLSVSAEIPSPRAIVCTACALLTQGRGVVASDRLATRLTRTLNVGRPSRVTAAASRAGEADSGAAG